MKIEYSDENVTAEIEVVRATVRMGLERTRMISSIEDDPDADAMFLFTRKISYPSLVIASPTGTVKVGGSTLTWPPTFDQFFDLPEELANRWFEAVQKLNPHWFQLPEIDEKKVSDASSA
jgi:hypothetical protein